jgi:D-alanine-D-alanine ligase
VRTPIQDAAVTAHNVLGLRDFSRSDFLVGTDGSFVLLETAITPGFTETSLFPFAVEAAGDQLGTLMRRLLIKAENR